MRRGSRSYQNLQMYDWRKVYGLPDNWIPKDEYDRLMAEKRTKKTEQQELNSATCEAAFSECVLIKKDDKDLIKKYKIKE